MKISIIILVVCFGLPACTNAKSFYLDNFLLLVTQQKFYNIQHSAGSFGAKEVGNEYYTASPGMTRYYNDITFNCGNNKLYVLKNEDYNKAPVLHNTLDILYFDENNKLQTTAQIRDMFDAATSISFDWTTKLLYWSERKNGVYSIKRTDESFETTEYIIFPQTEPAIDALEVYPKREELFFASSDNIWYASNSPSSTANLLFLPEQYPGWIYEITIDHATDQLYWVAGSRYVLHCVDIATTARPFNEADILKIRILEIVRNSPFNLAVFDNALYWMSYDEDWNSSSLEKTIYFKNGIEPAVRLFQIKTDTRLSIVSSRCPY